MLTRGTPRSCGLLTILACIVKAGVGADNVPCRVQLGIRFYAANSNPLLFGELRRSNMNGRHGRVPFKLFMLFMPDCSTPRAETHRFAFNCQAGVIKLADWVPTERRNSPVGRLVSFASDPFLDKLCPN